MSATTYSVPEITCDHCKSSIEAAVNVLPGVAAAVVDVDAKTVTVTGGAAAEIVGAIEAIGFDVAGTT